MHKCLPVGSVAISFMALFSVVIDHRNNRGTQPLASQCELMKFWLRGGQ